MEPKNYHQPGLISCSKSVNIIQCVLLKSAHSDAKPRTTDWAQVHLLLGSLPLRAWLGNCPHSTTAEAL